MKIPIVHDFTPAQARVAIELLDLLIGVLIDYHAALSRAYYPATLPCDDPEGSCDEP
jgi:hypothetical protein